MTMLLLIIANNNSKVYVCYGIESELKGNKLKTDETKLNQSTISDDTLKDFYKLK